MPKKTKAVQLQTGLPFLQKLKLTNFTLLGRNSFQFHEGLNSINFHSYNDKILFEFIINISLNPSFVSNNKMVNKNLFNCFLAVTIDSKKPIAFDVTIGILNYHLNELPNNFTNKSQITVEIEIDYTHNINKRIFDYTSSKYVPLTPKLEYDLYSYFFTSLAISDSFFPYVNLETQFKVLKYSDSKLFDYIANSFGLGTLQTDLYALKSQYNLLVLETNNLVSLKTKAEEERFILEKEVKMLEEIDNLDSKIADLEIEKDWSSYFDLKNKFESRTKNIDQNKEKLESFQKEKEKLETDLEQLNAQLNSLKEETESVTQNYDNSRKTFLSQKASLDKIDRNLKDWSSSVSKVEKDLKFKSMKLKDKEKKLTDLESRLKKSETESLIAQKEKLQAEINKDKKEIKNLQENLDAIKNEKNLKSKEKNIKEKTSQPLAEVLASFSSKITELTQSINEKENEKRIITAKLESLDNSIMKIKNELGGFEKEVKNLEIAISKEMEQIKIKKIQKPQNNRSLSTLQILQSQLENERNRLKSSIKPNTDGESLTKHALLMKNFDEELKSREKELKKIIEAIDEWDKNWNKIFSEKLHSSLEITNNLLQRLNIVLHQPKFVSLLPDEGALQLFYSQSNTKEIQQNLNQIIKPSFLVLSAIILSSIIVNKPNFYVLDISDNFSFSSTLLDNFFSIFNENINHHAEGTSQVSSQIIVLFTEDQHESVQYLKQYEINS